METAASVLSYLSKLVEPILTKIGGELTELTKNHVRYLFCFKSIVNDLKKEEANLRLAQDRVQQDVERATRNAEEIEKDVKKWLKEVSDVMAEFLKLEQEVQANRRCLSGCCPNWAWQYQLSKKAEKERSVMEDLVNTGKFTKVSFPPTLPGIEFLAPEGFELFESTRRAFDQIIEALKDDTVHIIGLYGMGGVGKTTLVKAVGNEAKGKKIFDEVVMATVSQNSVQNIQDQMAESLDMKFEEKTEVRRAKRLSLRLKPEKKTLIILDDVWRKLDLKTSLGISFDEGHKHCKILITTRLEQVCIDMNCQRKIRLNVLNEKEGLALFKSYASVGDNSPTLNALAIDIAEECKGLPLALVTIGSALKEKGTDEWNVVSQKLKRSKLVDLNNVIDVNVDVYTCLKLSYDYLKGEEIKLNFLLCSLFPEDYNIHLEDLVRYGIGLGMYQDVDSIEEARWQLRAMVKKLKASCLLMLENGDKIRVVKMHDMVRDVALEIAYKEKKFMSKAGMELIEWPKEKEECMKECTAISLMENKIQVLPNGLVCPKLEILLLSGEFRFYFTDVKKEFFEEMRSLKVFTLSFRYFSLESLQFLTNLRTLHLKHCKLEDISWIGKLEKLEILSLEGSLFEELPKELGELGKLRLLDLVFCTELERIPSNVIQRLSQLEELYIGSQSFKEWEVKATGTAESGNACLSELNSLSRLAKLSLDLNAKCLSEDLAFPKLLCYEITMNGSCLSYPTTRTLRIKDMKATSMTAFKALYRNLQYFGLNNAIGCQNIIPCIDGGGLNELNSLKIVNCNELEYIIDAKDQQLSLPATAFSNLVELSVHKVAYFKEICNGEMLPRGFLEKVEAMSIRTCHVIHCLFPAMLLQRLNKLKNLTIEICYKLQEVFQLQGISHLGDQNLGLLSSLEKLELTDLEELTCIWKGPSQHVSLQSLTHVQVSKCKSLISILSFSLAQSLAQLKLLSVHFCEKLEYIVKQKLEDNKGMKNEIVLPKLRKLKLEGLPNLISFSEENYIQIWSALEELILSDCYNLMVFFIAESEVNVQALKQQLRVLKVEGCNHLGEVVPALLQHGLKNLEELFIRECGLKVVFQIENDKLSLPNLMILRIEYSKELESLCKGPMHSLSLQNLSSITVISCHKLRHIFSITFARTLLQLQELHIFNCREMKRIMEVDDAEKTDDHEIVLPKLKHLLLKFLPNLINLSPEGYPVIFPSLEVLVESTCPKMTTRFSMAQNGFVHAEAKASQIDKEDERAQFPPEDNMNMYCWTHDELRKTLPPYLEK